MHESQDRRSALARLAAGASSIVVAAREMSASTAVAGEVDAEKKKKKKKNAPQYTWSLPWGPATFTKHPGNDPIRYLATVGAFGSGTWIDYRSGKKRTIDDAQLERIIMKQSNGGKMRGMPQLRLAGINWRVLFADFDPVAGTWSMDLRVCDSNPNARPDTTAAGVSSAGGVTTEFIDGGCSCGCLQKCYVCKANGAAGCANSCADACQSGCR